MPAYSPRQSLVAAGSLAASPPYSSIPRKSAAHRIQVLAKSLIDWLEQRAAARSARRRMLAAQSRESKRAGQWGSNAEAERIAALSCPAFNPFRID